MCIHSCFGKKGKDRVLQPLKTAVLQRTAPGLLCEGMRRVCKVLLPGSGSLKHLLEVSLLRREQEGWRTERPPASRHSLTPSPITHVKS